MDRSKNYKVLRNTLWEDHLAQCRGIQSCLPKKNVGVIDEADRKKRMDKVDVQLKFWQQRAKDKWLAWEDS